MTGRGNKALIAFVALLAASSVAYGGWAVHLVDSVLVAERNNEKHPKSLTLRMQTPEAFNAGVAVCVVYGNSAAKSKGKVTATVSRFRDGVQQEQRVFSGKVQRVDTGGVDTGDLGEVRANAWFDCGEFGPMQRGEEVAFVFKLKGFPKLRSNNDTIDGATIAGALVPNDLGLTPRARRAALVRVQEALRLRMIPPSDR